MTHEATIRNIFNLDLRGLIGVGLDVGMPRFKRHFGVQESSQPAETASDTVTAIGTSHKWAAKVGKYNDDPIWAEIFANIRENRSRLIQETLTPSESENRVRP